MPVTLISSALRDIREGSGVSQEWLARRLHISRAALASYENGRRNVPMEMLSEANKILAGRISSNENIVN